MKRLMVFFACAALFVAACGGGDDNGNGGSSVFIAAEDADRIARAAMPTADELPGTGWQVIAEDNFGESDGDDGIWEYIQDEPACAGLQDLAALGSVFGSEESDTVVGRAQTEYENLETDGLIPTSVEIEIEVEESVAATQGAWTVVSELFNSDETTRCFVSMFNTMFEEDGAEEGIEVSVTEGQRLASSPPQNAVSMAFEIEMSFLGIDFDMAIQIYLWPYGNAQVQVMFLGSGDDLTSELVNGVLTLVDQKLRDAAD